MNIASLLIELLIILLVVGVIWWVGQIALSHIPSPVPLVMIWNVIMAVVTIVILLKFLLLPLLSGGLAHAIG